MRISTTMVNQNALNGIETAEAQASQTQAQLSSGKRINSPSDDPVGAVQLLQLNNVNSQNQQYLSNGTAANTNLSLENSALTTATTTLQSIRDLVVEANSGTNTPAELKDIATQISSLEGQLQGAANTQNSQGQYLFAGFSSGTQPFARGSSGSMAYLGDNGTSSVQIDSGTSVQTGDPGSSVFMNIQGGNGTFSTSAGTNAGTGVVDAGSVVNAATYQAAQTTSPAPYTITFSTPTTYTVTDGASNTVTPVPTIRPRVAKSSSTASRSVSAVHRHRTTRSPSRQQPSRASSIRSTTSSVRSTTPGAARPPKRS
jgi:flagellar hook-associated protein 3 FlgL